MSNYTDRYANFRDNGKMNIIPGLSLPELSTDKQDIYKVGQTRLDKLSDKYYNNPYSGWLILLANQNYGGLEFLIPDQSLIRIPFPFESAVRRYSEAIAKHTDLYGK